ncbi:MAG: lysozyme inhibitor LprI family protein [Pseudomonadota bacterium]
MKPGILTGLIWLFLGVSSPALADGLVFDPSATSACLAAQETQDAALLCAGRAAEACIIATPGGYSTVAMAGCLDRELTWWDAALNAAYADALRAAKEADASGAYGPRGRPEAERSLREMQRAWIPFRDARCIFEEAKWGGGTGGGPAFIGCLMQETARQTLILRRGMGL